MSYTFVEGGVCAPKGFTAGGVHAGIRKNPEKKDLALIFADRECAAAAVYTKNKVKGAPLKVTAAHLENGRARAVLCNSGNANTCNADGIYIAEEMCKSAAEIFNIDENDIIIASTGVIGQPLPIEPVKASMGALKESLSLKGSPDAASAIMTTDTKLKEAAISFELQGKACFIGGIAKGSGMIHPNMATMLCFVTTDVAISPELLKEACRETADDTFNMISVDGDTSTNDMFTIMASGEAGNTLIEERGEDYDMFKEALFTLCRKLSKELAADGEGATKLLECTVKGAPDKATAGKIAKSVVCSNLLKAAMFGKDANWGRILCAIGYTDGDFDVSKAGVSIASSAGRITVCRDGAGVPFSEAEALKILSENEILIEADLCQGEGEATAWGCDLTYDYVRINGDYRT